MDPVRSADATVVVLTPGVYNSAFLEHAFLAKAMGVELVQGPDLYVDDGYVVMRTTHGPKRGMRSTDASTTISSTH